MCDISLVGLEEMKHHISVTGSIVSSKHVHFCLSNKIFFMRNLVYIRMYLD